YAVHCLCYTPHPKGPPRLLARGEWGKAVRCVGADRLGFRGEVGGGGVEYGRLVRDPGAGDEGSGRGFLHAEDVAFSRLPSFVFVYGEIQRIGEVFVLAVRGQNDDFGRDEGRE